MGSLMIVECDRYGSREIICGYVEEVISASRWRARGRGPFGGLLWDYEFESGADRFASPIHVNVVDDSRPLRLIGFIGIDR